MKCVIVYCSLTGNTEKIAKVIQAGVKQAAGHCDIIRIKEANPKRLYGYDLIGLGAPVHKGREPANVTAFIKDMRFIGGKHLFVFSTHGAMLANFFACTILALKERGAVVIGQGDWYAAAYGLGLPYPYLTDGHPDEIDLKEAAAFGREMVSRSERIMAGETDLIPEVPAIDPRFVYEENSGAGEAFPSLRELTKYEADKCLYPSCRLCMENCPVDGIDLTVAPIIRMEPCIECELCQLICPTGALSLNSELAEHSYVREICVPVLREVEAEGRFRRLVPEEKVGWDTPTYKVFNRHPRWIIGKGHPSR